MRFTSSIIIDYINNNQPDGWGYSLLRPINKNTFEVNIFNAPYSGKIYSFKSLSECFEFLYNYFFAINNK